MHAPKSPLFALCLLTALGQAACAPSVPADPSWEEDVKPILAANCVRCHREEAQNGAEAYDFRLDVCADVAPKMGAASMIGAALARVQNDRAPMPPPPAARLSDRQIEVLQNWSDDGAPCAGTAGAAPAFVLLRPVEESLVAGAAAGPALVLRYAVESHDGAPLRATLVAVSSAGEAHVAPAQALAAHGELRWSVASLPAGSYELLVALDRGAEVRAGTFHIPQQR